ncbi:ribonuclease R family protein [Terriglobus tenax]|uniref:ribonuclease R family protein n=1 Tax=Terriglobus tenax TaxID=1111115 RepID=UPI0021DFC100|nr:VacB/RNase II family 3'-5' exoribonuclease [Terriglobus tenax]
MAGHYPQTDRELLRLIERAPGGRAGYKQLIRELGLGGGRERRLLLEHLARLTASGQLQKVDREQWSLPAKPSPPSSSQTKGGVSIRRGKYPSAASQQTRDNLIAGKLDLHRDGFGFVRIPGEDDVFIPPPEINGAMQGDQVLIELGPPQRDGRRSGRIARVLTRKHPTIVGIFHYARPQKRHDNPLVRGNYVTPLDERMTQPVLIPDGMEVPVQKDGSPHRVLGEEARAQLDEDWRNLEGMAVDVEITNFPNTSRPATGRVIEVLGDKDAFGVDVEIIIRKHHLPHTFPDNVLEEARERATALGAPSIHSLIANGWEGFNHPTITPSNHHTRTDFRSFPIVTIDGETAKDFDDAVHARLLPNGNWELQVHIADVAEYVTPGSDLDLEARLRGTSVYFPDRAIPMLPMELSTGMCSLRPHEDRLVLSCVMEIDSRGEVLRYEVMEGIIRSAQRMTYTNVQRVLDDDPQALREFADLVPEFQRMETLSRLLNQKRVRRGSIDFDLPEPVVQFNEAGEMQGIVRSQRIWAHRLIEEFMLSANECVATWIEAQGVPGIYRIHETPDAKRIVEFEETAASFGYSLGIGSLPVKKIQTRGDRRDVRGTGRAAKTHEVADAIPVTPKMYQKLTARISGKPEERILAYLMLRSLKQAVYSAQNEGHFALASPTYTHFTSPIRRYPDLITHRIVKELLHTGANPAGSAVLSDKPSPWGNAHFAKHASDAIGPIDTEELTAIAQESSERERGAEEAERELIEWKKIKFMQDRVGEDFDAMILSATKYGLFVELDGLFVEGLVPLDSLRDDRYYFNESSRRITGDRTGRSFQMGQKVHVLLDRVDRINRRLQFAIVEEDGSPLEPLPRGDRPEGGTPRAARPGYHPYKPPKKAIKKGTRKSIKREQKSKRKKR